MIIFFILINVYLFQVMIFFYGFSYSYYTLEHNKQFFSHIDNSSMPKLSLPIQ